MTWHLHLWEFRLRSPLHLGFHRIMNFARTRPYVSSKLLWGALTSKLAPALEESGYQRVGNLLKKGLRLSYLFPKAESELFMPHYGKSGLMFGSLSQTEFENRFIATTASTAIDSDSLSADEGALHEVEFMNPYTINNQEPVFVTGWIWIRELSDNGLRIIRKNGRFLIEYGDHSVDLEQGLVNRLQVGGELKYGFGLLELKLLKKCDDKRLMGFQGEWSGTENDVHLRMSRGDAIWSHARYSGKVNVRGNIEPLVGRDWDDNKGAGRKLSALGLFWCPGSILDDEESFRITDFGFWEAIS